MIYGETGRYPLYINVYTRIITYWGKMLISPENKIVYTVYRYLFLQHFNSDCKSPWIDCIQRILNMCGLQYVWQNHNFVNIEWLSATVNQRLKDQFMQIWSNDINCSSRGQVYKILKPYFGFEKYLDILPVKLRKKFIKFRTSNHRFPVETGRWYNIPLNERLCLLCNKGLIGDEFHYILECSALEEIRKKYINTKYWKRPNFFKFSELMTNCNCKSLRKLCVFISKIVDAVCSS